MSERPISQRGAEGRAKVKQQMVRDGNQIHFLPLSEVSRDCTGRPHNNPVHRPREESAEGRGGDLIPVSPEDLHVYDDRTPAMSPKPSSQKPGSYCFSPFGCPARG